ncbi:MAG: ATP-dependent helicase HrpB [Archangiaceae bacterium]|nr:ATP-dependent helicase HrpB [Archangiaceae bacterium]
MTPLPIDTLLPKLVQELRAGQAAVLEAPPGAGKTTRVPPALLDAGLAGAGEIVVLQPRRLATRVAALRVAEERGERLGETVGYQIRFEDVSGPKTRIRFLTEGLLTRRLVTDPTLKGVGAVLLDEFHERHIASDLALSLLRRLQQGPRPDLKLLVMSATLDAEAVATWLGGAPRLRSEGRRFELTIEHLPADDDRYLDQQVLGALKRLLQAQLDGDVLVFLPGAAEIRRAAEACADLAARHDLELHTLHGDLSSAEQDRAIKPGKRRKVILSTNVAETSVTIEGVAAVIDSGLARVAAHSPWSGLPTLKLQKISKASATQRAGRAGRTRAGTVLRLYTRGDFEQRPMNDVPEIRRVDLADAALALHGSGVTSLRDFPFFEAPPTASLEAADALLHLLGAVDKNGATTEIGRRLMRFPVHPRVGRLLLEAERRGVAQDGASIAALLGERSLSSASERGPGRGKRDVLAGPSDVLEQLDRYREAQAVGARGAGVDPARFNAVDRVQKQLARMLDGRREAPKDREEALMLSVLAGFPDRLAKRRRPRSPELVLAGGGSATLDETSGVHDEELMVAVDAEERRGGVFVRVASKVEPEWILETSPDALSELDELQWNAQSGRVERVTRLAVGNVVLEETRKPAEPNEAAARVLAGAALAAGPERFVDPEALTSLRTRIEQLRSAYPEAHFPAMDDAFVRAALEELCVGLRTFDEIREAGLLNALNNKLTAEQARLLAREVPDRIVLAGGRSVRINYEAGKPPWLESRLQDFFGATKGPTVCGGRVPVVLHLLAPNQRAVQVSTDLAGFWQRHYPAIRRELMRQYPKHAWPEDPLTAKPPPPKPPRPR